MYHFPVTGSITSISDAQGHKLMDNISPQWEDEITSLGELYMGVYNWAYSSKNGVIELHIPRLVSGDSIPKNESASKLFGFEVYGDCFLIPKKGQEAKIESIIQSITN